MKSILFFFFGLTISFNLLAQSDIDLIIKDVNIITMTNSSVISNKSILIQNGKIIKIDDFKNLSKTKNISIIEGKGKFLMPALAEMHTHLLDENKLDTLLIENLAAGVTHIRVMYSKIPLHTLKKHVNDYSAFGMNFKLHYGYIIGKDVKFSEKQFDSLMIEIKKNGYNFIKLFSVADEGIFKNLMKSANRNNVIVCGHFPISISIDTVLNYGFKSIEHLGGYDKINDPTVLSNVIKLTKEKSTFNCPTLDWDIMSNDLQYPDDYKNRLIFFNAPKNYIQKWESEYSNAIEKDGNNKVLSRKEKYFPTFRYKQEILKKLSENNCLLLLGSDPGNYFQMNGFNMYEEMINWSKAGIDNFTILKSATITPAMFFNEQNIWGTVEIGKSADLIILEKNPLDEITNIKTVETTIIDGNVFRKVELLKKLK